jgi:hypothetical protein
LGANGITWAVGKKPYDKNGPQREKEPATREYLLTIYANKIAALPEREREKFVSALQDLSCTRDSSNS